MIPSVGFNICTSGLLVDYGFQVLDSRCVLANYWWIMDSSIALWICISSKLLVDYGFPVLDSRLLLMYSRLLFVNFSFRNMVKTRQDLKCLK